MSSIFAVTVLSSFFPSVRTKAGLPFLKICTPIQYMLYYTMINMSGKGEKTECSKNGFGWIRQR